MVLTASFVLSPVTGLFCHRRLRILAVSVRSDRPASANLTPASGRQDHTTSPSAATSLVSVLLIAHKSFDSPCDPLARKTLPRPPHPIPTFVTMANAPLAGRDDESSRCDLGWVKMEIFLQRGTRHPYQQTARRANQQTELFTPRRGNSRFSCSSARRLIGSGTFLTCRSH
jgi:hypothetical protein